MDGPRAAAYTAFIFSRRIRIFCTTIYAAKGGGVYGLIGRKHITSVLPVREKSAEPPAQTVGRSFFCVRRVVIDSFERDVLHLQLGGTLPLADIARIEEPDD